jgi:hypothetical protein
MHSARSAFYFIGELVKLSYKIESPARLLFKEILAGHNQTLWQYFI